MNAIQKLIKRHGTVKKLSTCGFINPDGSYVQCIGGKQHVIACKLANTSLHLYLKAGGARVFNYATELAVEHYTPLTEEQKLAIISLARWNLIGTITINCDTEQKDGGYYGTRSLGNAMRKMLE